MSLSGCGSWSETETLDKDSGIAAAQRGQEVLICKNGKPVARIEALKDRGFGLNELYGLTKGRIEAEAGWDAPLKEDVIEALFDGNHP